MAQPTSSSKASYYHKLVHSSKIKQNQSPKTIYTKAIGSSYKSIRKPRAEYSNYERSSNSIHKGRHHTSSYHNYSMNSVDFKSKDKVFSFESL